MQGSIANHTAKPTFLHTIIKLTTELHRTPLAPCLRYEIASHREVTFRIASLVLIFLLYFPDVYFLFVGAASDVLALLVNRQMSYVGSAGATSQLTD